MRRQLRGSKRRSLGILRLDFWTLVMAATLAVMGLLLIWPLLHKWLLF